MDHSKKKRTRKGSHSYSVLQGKAKYCYVTGRTEDLDKHHIYHGEGVRTISDKHGFWVYIWHPLHDAGCGGLHKYPESGLDLKLKQDCQRRFEEIFVSRQETFSHHAIDPWENARKEFMKIIGKNYLGDEKPQTPADNDGFYLLEGGEE